MISFKNYNGNNQYIKNMIDKNLPITPFREEYLNTNFMFCGYDLKLQDLTIGVETKDLLSKQQIKFHDKDTIICERLIGETAEFYHFESNNVSFFTYKKDTENPYKRQYRDVIVDFDYYTSVCKMPNFKGFLDHQKEGIKFLVGNPHGFNFDDMGLGKTMQSIVAAIACKAQKVLLLTLASTKINHRLEVEYFGEKAVVIDDAKSIKGNEDAKFFIVNYDRLKKFIPIKGKSVDLNFLDMNFDTIIVDEIHMAGNPKSIRGTAINTICSHKSVKRIWGLSGTPIENNIHFWNICSVLNLGVSDIIPKNVYKKMELYEDFALRYCNAIKMPSPMKYVMLKIAQIDKIIKSKFNQHVKYKTILRVLEALSKNDSGGLYIKFENEKIYLSSIIKIHDNDKDRLAAETLNKNIITWLLQNTDSIKTITILGKKNADGIIIKNSNSLEFAQRIKHTYIRRNTQNTLQGFYEKYVDKIYLEMTSAELKQYNIYFEQYLQIKKDLGYNIENIGRAVETMKLAQLLACFKVEHTVGFLDNLMEIGKKVVLFTHFEQEMKMFEAKYENNKQVVFMKSSMDATKRQNVQNQFQTNEDVKLIIGNIQVMGTGINLTKGDIVIFNSPDWSNKLHEQAEKRTHRIGRIGDVFVYYMIYKDTEEEYIYAVNTTKGDNIETVIGK